MQIMKKILKTQTKKQSKEQTLLKEDDHINMLKSEELNKQYFNFLS
jgi:hypothetical protein